MKKIFVLLLATAMIFALAACGATPNGTDNNNTQDDHQAETPDASYEAPQITELYNEDFDYTDGVGNSGHYAYRVPQIEADTQGAEAINKAISDAYTPIVNGVLEDVSDKVSLSCFYVAWESYQYENILSLVVSCGWDADVNEYNVYLYDIASGQQLTTAGLLKALDVEETVFLEAVRRAAAAKFDTQYGAIAGGDTDEFLTERRDWTLSDENINMDVRTYADGDGKLHVVLPIGSIAGADSYEQVLSLDDLAGALFLYRQPQTRSFERRAWQRNILQRASCNRTSADGCGLTAGSTFSMPYTRPAPAASGCCPAPFPARWSHWFCRLASRRGC